MKWIKDIVSGLIETYKTRDIYEILNCLDICIIRKELVTVAKGMLFRDFFGNEYIFLDSSLTYEEEKIVLAHELGHAILHTSISSDYYFNSLLNKSKIEYQANYFAAEFLIDINKVDETELKGMGENQLAAYFNVPVEFLYIFFNSGRTYVR